MFTVPLVGNDGRNTEFCKHVHETTVDSRAGESKKSSTCGSGIVCSTPPERICGMRNRVRQSRTPGSVRDGAPVTDPVYSAPLVIQKQQVNAPIGAQSTRRLTLERAIGTPSGQNLVWSGYQPYNPAMVEQYLTIFRAVYNWIQVGKDGKTPAMRLGLASSPLNYGDVLQSDPLVSHFAAAAVA